MTLVGSEYPRERLGQLAEADGMSAAEGPWIAGREATWITGIATQVLARWEQEGVLSILQRVEGAPRLYLKPELQVLAGLSVDGPPNLRAVRRYIKDRQAEKTKDLKAGQSDRAMADRLGNSTRPGDASGPGTSVEAGFVVRLLGLAQGQRFTAELLGERRVRLAAGPGSRGVEIGCRRRAGDGDRCWFTWGDTAVWICEADNPTEALLMAKSALRKIEAPR